MQRPSVRAGLFAALIGSACASAVANEFAHPDHYEFDASINVAFRAQDGIFPIRLHFDYPGASDATAAAWVLDVVAPNGSVVALDRGVTPLDQRHVRIPARWNGRDRDGRTVAPGYYTLRLRAVPTVVQAGDELEPMSGRVDEAFSLFGDELVEQRYDVQVGDVAPARVQPRKPLDTGTKTTRIASSTDEPTSSIQSVPANDALPYTIYFGNFHSQTNHSDGGADVSTCSGSAAPQTGQFGPTDAFAMMHTQAGGDFLLASEHNHMYDGSTSTDGSTNPADAIALFDSGVQAATNYTSANPGFMSFYGLEWGVISNGGHLNILNPDALANWEVNSAGQLIGEVNTPKSDYAALYATLNQRGWVGQFNHPATSGQFVVNGIALGYDPNGVQVMALAEVLNTSAFSTNTTETETSRSSYVGAWNMLLERGYKVAPATNQDNHCANWGLSFTNRTGVLLPSDVALTRASFLDAVKARRTFATEDRSGQLVLTGDGQVMGSTITNNDALTLTAHYASTSGQTAQRIQFFEGVPGRNGTVTQLHEGSDTHTFTPAAGEHFYYALVTQANGLRLWSAPLWVSQGTSSGGDTTAPTVTASTSGTSGTITLSASASDDVGVAKVEFYVDGVLKGSDTSSPYSMTLDSTTLANGSHGLVAKAYDAANNIGTSSTVTFQVDNSTGTGVELLTNGGFESGSTGWAASKGVITNSSTYPAHSGSWKAWLNGSGSSNTEYVRQGISIPSDAGTVTLGFWLRVASDETTTTAAYDTLKVHIRSSSNKVLATLGTFSNLDKGTSYVERSFDVSAWRGQSVRIYFEGTEGSRVATSFLIDDVSVSVR